MTVGYLKEQLENYPDEARIVLDCGPLSELLKDPIESHMQEIELIDMFSVVQAPNIIFMQLRTDFDFMEELKEKIKYLRDSKKANNWKEILLNQGFTEDEIKEVEHVSE